MVNVTASDKRLIADLPSIEMDVKAAIKKVVKGIKFTKTSSNGANATPWLIFFGMKETIFQTNPKKVRQQRGTQLFVIIPHAMCVSPHDDGIRFVGREKILDIIDKVLRKHKAVNKCAVTLNDMHNNSGITCEVGIEVYKFKEYNVFGPEGKKIVAQLNV